MIIKTNNSVMGQNISYLRKKKSLSINQMANLIGMDPNTLLDIENQKIRFLNDTQLFQLCTVFEITVEELMEIKME